MFDGGDEISCPAFGDDPYDLFAFHGGMLIHSATRPQEGETNRDDCQSHAH